MNSDTGLITTSTPKTPAPTSVPTRYEGGLFGYSENEKGTLKFDDDNERLVFFGKDNKENKFHRFGGAVVNAMGVGAEGKIKKSHLVSSASHFPSLVFGKIKSLWSASTTNTTIGLNLLADSDRPKKRRSKNLEAEVEMQNVTVTSGNELFLPFISCWFLFCLFDFVLDFCVYVFVFLHAFICGC